MKKLHILIPSLVATASMPLIGVVGCGNKSTPTTTFYIVQFNTQGGTFVDAQKVEGGNIATEPGESATTREGYAFSGWFDDKACSEGKEHNFDLPVKGDQTVYAKWIYTGEYSVSVTNPTTDGYSIQEQTAKLNEDITLHISSLTDMTVNSLCSVTIDNEPYQDLSSFTLVDSKNATFFISGEFIKGRIEFCFQHSNPPAVNDFETDDWSTVIYYANRGISALAQAYQQESSWFVGKTRDIMLNGVTHKVRVIGVNQDYVDVNSQQAATLTFQFDNLVSDSDGKYLATHWGESLNNGAYWDGLLENALNSTESVDWVNNPAEHQSVYSMIYEGDRVVGQNIKNVYRGVNVRIANKWLVKQKSIKIFTATISNIFTKEGLENEETIHAIRNYLPIVLAEGQKIDGNKQYAYYNQLIGDDPFIDEPVFPSLLRQDCQASPTIWSYWFSSPALGGTAAAWAVMTYEYIDVQPVNFAECAVAPCFCI